MASVTVNLAGITDNGEFFNWGDNVSIGSTFAAGGLSQTLGDVALFYAGNSAGRAFLSLEGTNNRFTSAFESTGRFIFTASDGETLEVTIANADITEPYQWIPSNSADVIAFANHVRGLTDTDATLTLTDDLASPAFAHAVGDSLFWTLNIDIPPIMVPAATGNPTPTYMVEGVLPSGLVFSTPTRVISGIPTRSRSGTIRVRATNSEGTADWTVAYTTLETFVTVNLTGYDDTQAGGTVSSWLDDVSIGSNFAANGQPQTLTEVGFVFANGRASLSLEGTNNRFTSAFESTGRFIFTASDGETLEVTIANADITEPYQWIPSNSADVIAFANHVRNDLTDQTARLTLTDDPAGLAAKYNGNNVTDAKYNGNDIIAAKYNGVTIF